MKEDVFHPSAIVEIKKFAEGGSVDSIVADLRKSDLLKLAPPLEIYAGILVCETARSNLQKRKIVLQDKFRERIAFSEFEVSKSPDGWKWCFACVESPAF